ncbi:Protein of unknown function [Gryllus bimaculatus]|nr:Protein of unknown function [Gryllus bimaculatus]
MIDLEKCEDVNYQCRRNTRNATVEMNTETASNCRGFQRDPRPRRSSSGGDGSPRSSHRHRSAWRAATLVLGRPKEDLFTVIVLERIVVLFPEIEPPPGKLGSLSGVKIKVQVFETQDRFDEEN